MSEVLRFRSVEVLELLVRMVRMCFGSSVVVLLELKSLSASICVKSVAVRKYTSRGFFFHSFCWDRF